MTLLLVDDNPAFARTLTDICHLLGIRVIAASTGQDAIAFAQTGRFHAALINLTLPDKDGVEVFQQVRLGHKSGRFAFVTGSSSTEVYRKARATDVPVLLKPLSFIDVLDLVRPAVNAVHRRDTEAAEEPIRRFSESVESGKSADRTNRRALRLGEEPVLRTPPSAICYRLSPNDS